MNNRQIAAFAVGPIGAAALSLVSLALVTWYFPPAVIGQNGIFQTFLTCATVIVLLGLDQAYVREYHESACPPQLLRTCLRWSIAVFCIFGAFSLPLASKISELLYGVADATLFFLSLAGLLASLISRFLALVLRMEERGLVYSATQILPKAGLVLILTALAVVPARPDYSALLSATVASMCLGTSLLLWATRSELARVGQPGAVIPIGTLLRFGLPLSISGIAYWVLASTGILVLRGLGDFGELGIYVTAVSLAGVAAILQNVFSSVWMPTVYKWAKDQHATEKVRAVTQQVLAVICVCFALIGSFAWLLDYILPAHYFHVKTLIVSCAAQPLLYTLSECTIVGVNIYRRSAYALAATAFAAMSNLLLCIWLAPVFGAAGAAAATALAFLVFLFARTEFSAKLLAHPQRRRFYSPVVIATLAAVVTTLVGPAYSPAASVLWVGALVAYIYYFRTQLRSVVASTFP